VLPAIEIDPAAPLPPINILFTDILFIDVNDPTVNVPVDGT
jgi:hypothetical protein